MLGRSTEQARLRALVAAALGGHGGATTLVAPAGAGKTSLLEWLADDVGSTCAVARVTGTEAEADLPWAALGEVVRPFLDHADDLPGPQARALRTALAVSEEVDGGDRLAVGLGALGVVTAASQQQPVLVVVDDLQWIDAESRQALAFVARRIGDDRVAVVAGSRPGDVVPLGTAEALAPLDAATVTEILVQQGVRSPVAQEAIAEQVDGNPLLALQLAASLTKPERAGARPIPTTFRVPAVVADLYAPQLDALPDGARGALTLVAADRSGDPSVVEAGLSQLDLGLGHLEPAEEAGLVEVGGGAVRFTHPLARSAAYQGASGPLRRRAHLALACVLGEDSPEGVLHRAAAAVGPDADLAEQVAKLAADADHRGAPLTAATRWVEAASLSREGTDRAGCFVAGARSAVGAGEIRWAGELLAEAGRADRERAEALDARRVQVRMAVAAARFDEARTLAEEADAAFADREPVAVAELLAEAARPLLVEAPLHVLPLAERAWDLARRAGGAAALYTEVLYGCARFLQGDLEAAARHTSRWRELLELEGPVVAGPFLAETVVLYQGYSQQGPAAMALLDEIEPSIRAGCAAGALVSVLSARAFLTYGVDLRACVAAGREALDLSVETGQPGLTLVAESTLSVAAASVGDEPLTTQVCDRLLASGAERTEVWARAALGRLYLVQNRPEQAAEQFALLRARIGPENRSFTQFEADEAESLVRVGRSDDARAILPALQADAEARGGWSVGQHERILALLADDIDTAAEHFERARAAMAQGENKIAQGIVELTWGEWLRRAKRRAEARKHLDRAIELFGLVGAVGLRTRAEEELIAAGGASDRSRPTAELLAATELQVARLAAAGATNRDIAGQLFISPRTVENHLGAVYRKLGVSGRPGLAARAAKDPALRPTQPPA